MVFEEHTYELDNQHWRRINMRKVAHLAGAEMIHNLYDRYWPQINSIRFRHTITNFRDGIVESYAPTAEWASLQRWVSEKFIKLDPILLREIERILSPTYEITNEICKIIDDAELATISNADLALHLIDIMDFPLGEIYKLNVVQVEYGLNYALHRLLEEYEPDASERNQLLAQLISPKELTVAQREEVAFDALLANARKKNATTASESAIKKSLQAHYDEYAGKHCAYGETPPTLSDYERKFDKQIASKELITMHDAVAEANKLHAASQAILRSLDDERLTVLCDLMSRIGVFRDNNKAKVGETVLRRLRLMDEIARRTKVDRKDLNLYLISDMVALLDNGQPLAAKTLARRHKGVSFIREDHLSLEPVKSIRSTAASTTKKITGVCASPGELTGQVKVVRTKADIAKMQPGDVMVAIGTDFDLLEIMHLSAGIITEEGGLLSHASVVSRELGKPCLIGVTDVTQTLHDDDTILLNATAGYVEILKSPKE